MSTITVLSQTDEMSRNTQDRGFDVASDDEDDFQGYTEDEHQDGDIGDGEDGDVDALFDRIEEDESFKDKEGDSEDKPLREKTPAFLNDDVFNTFSTAYRPSVEPVLISLSSTGSIESTLLHSMLDDPKPKTLSILKRQLLVRLILNVTFEEKSDSILVTPGQRWPEREG